MPADALAVHGLTAEFLADKPLFGAVADELLAFVGDAPLVAHNVGFDIAFLNTELKRAGPLITLRMGRITEIARSAIERSRGRPGRNVGALNLYYWVWSLLGPSGDYTQLEGGSKARPRRRGMRSRIADAPTSPRTQRSILRPAGTRH